MTTCEKTKEKRLEQVKIYEPRPTLLTRLFEKDKYFRSLYYLCVTLIISFIISTAITNYKKDKRFYLGSKLIAPAFRNFDVAVLISIGLFFWANLVYGAFMTWALLRNKLKATLWDKLWIYIYILHFLFVLYYSCKLVTVYDLGIASSIAVLTETVRLLMKTHSFVRSNCPKYLNDDKDQIHPTNSHYLYFLFAPVLLYKESYPRSNDPIRWGCALRLFVEFFIGIFFFSIIFDNCYVQPLKDCGFEHFSSVDVLLVYVQNFYVAIIMLLIFFYCGFQGYFNGMGELLRFSDRMFYGDWWMANTTAGFLRTWNVIVYDWLYEYIYKESYQNLFPGNTTISRLLVLFVSAVFHDFIICFSTRIYIPAFVISYTCLGSLIQLRLHNPTWILWLLNGFTINGIFTFTTAEYFARNNCPMQNESFIGHFKIRLLSC